MPFSITHKITIIQLMANIRPAELVPVVDETIVSEKFFKTGELSNFSHYWEPAVEKMKGIHFKKFLHGIH